MGSELEARVAGGREGVAGEFEWEEGLEWDEGVVNG